MTRTLTDLLFPFPQAQQVPLDLFGRCLQLTRDLRELIPDPGPIIGTGAERRIGGLLFAEGPAVVGRLTAAMIRRPALFAGYPDPQPLLLRQMRATGWRAIAGVLLELHERAMALSRLEQSAATREALRILRQVRAAARGFYATFTDKQRALAVSGAERALGAWQHRKHGKGSGR